MKVKKKMKEGGSLGMKSVKAGFDENSDVTKADFVAIGKGEAKYGKKVAKKAKDGASLKKQAATAIAMKKAGKAPKKAMGGMKMMGGGKCKYGC